MLLDLAPSVYGDAVVTVNVAPSSAHLLRPRMPGADWVEVTVVDRVDVSEAVRLAVEAVFVEDVEVRATFATDIERDVAETVTVAVSTSTDVSRAVSDRIVIDTFVGHVDDRQLAAFIIATEEDG